MRNALFILALTLISGWSCGQHLAPGFDRNEFGELLRIHAQLSKTTAKTGTVPEPAFSKLVYSSQEMGLANLWQLWQQEDSTAVIAIRGTTGNNISWLANLYAAQVPAKGVLEIDSNFVFAYELAQHPAAAVHVGYLFCSAFLARDMLPKIDSCYHRGVRDFLITGHSQGGGLSYILTAYFLNLQQQGKLQADIRFKTYACASPKPGNLYFAYTYESLTQEGWSFNVVSTEDWVPQTPLTVQTLSDFPDVNPHEPLLGAIKKQPFFKRLFLRSIYRKATRPSQKAADRYHTYFGAFSEKNVRKIYPNFIKPTYAIGNEYVRVGAHIVLYPDVEYYQKFKVPKDNRNMMFHHSLKPYYYLFEHYAGEK